MKWFLDVILYPQNTHASNTKNNIQNHFDSSTQSIGSTNTRTTLRMIRANPIAQITVWRFSSASIFIPSASLIRFTLTIVSIRGTPTPSGIWQKIRNRRVTAPPCAWWDGRWILWVHHVNGRRGSCRCWSWNGHTLATILVKQIIPRRAWLACTQTRHGILCLITWTSDIWACTLTISQNTARRLAVRRIGGPHGTLTRTILIHGGIGQHFAIRANARPTRTANMRTDAMTNVFIKYLMQWTRGSRGCICGAFARTCLRIIGVRMDAIGGGLAVWWT